MSGAQIEITHNKWLAQQGSKIAQYNLGLLYYKGEGVSVDASQGAQWLRKSAEQGLVDVQVMMGGIYATGNGFPRLIGATPCQSESWSD